MELLGVVAAGFRCGVWLVKYLDIGWDSWRLESIRERNDGDADCWSVLDRTVGD